MAFIFILIIALFILPDFYIWQEYISGQTSMVWSMIYWAPSLIAILTMIVAVSGLYSIRKMRIFFGIMMCIALPKLQFTILSLIGLAMNGTVSDATSVFNRIGIVVAVISCLIFSYGFIFGWKILKVRDTTLEYSDLPDAFDGYRILQVTDLHLGTFENKKRLIRAMVARIHSLHPDLIVFTGDLVNADAKEINPYMGILSNMKAGDGIFSVLGNHDYCEYSRYNSLSGIKSNICEVKQYEAELGWNLLLNDNRTIHRGSDSINIIGVENDGRPPFPSYGNLPKAMKGLTDNSFNILLSHDPTHWRREVLPETNIQLMFSGHTHGMQLKIGKVSPSRLAFREWGGIYREGERTLCISLGIGGTVPFRLGAWPEINVITLKKKKSI
jgi:uncharacterized protein